MADRICTDLTRVRHDMLSPVANFVGVKDTISSKKSLSERWSYALPILVTSYMVLAIGWWAVLIHREHNLLFDTYAAMSEAGIDYQDDLVDLPSMDTVALKSLEQRRRVMILSETIFIGISILIGLFLIHRAYRRLIKNQRMKQNFLLSISHELKSPIASIKLSLQSLIKLFHKSTPPSPATLEAIANQGIQEADRLHSLVNNVLISTRLDAGYVAMHTEVELHPTLQKWIRRFKQIYPQSTIDLRMRRADDKIAIDINALELVLSNLIDNALKYGGKPAKVMVKVDGNDQRLDIRVDDNGIGVPDHEHKTIFERFYRIGDERVRKTKGTGLGLYLVKSLLENNDATINVGKSELGGSSFSIAWPLRA